MRDPEQAAHVLGKLLRYVGEDNVLWGTDCIFYGSPQDQIQALRAFRISPDFQERYGYPALTPLRKAKVLGLNGARIYGVEPKKRRYRFTRRELEQIRGAYPSGTRRMGRATSARSSVYAHTTTVGPAETRPAAGARGCVLARAGSARTR
jgi:hypothetical protein